MFDITKRPIVIAGPCAVESEEQAEKICSHVSKYFASAFRAGVYKGQNRPIVNGKPCYWGMGDEGLDVLYRLKKKYNIPVVTEIQSEDQLAKAIGSELDILQIGARHMQNFPLIRSIAKKWNKPVILKRGLGSTIDEWMGVYEHLASNGNKNIMLCERGIVSFERANDIRWRLDVLAIPQIKSDYPDRIVLADVSHGCGRREFAIPMARAAIAAGADGVIVEVHSNPEESKTDGRQTIDLATYEKLVCAVAQMYTFIR